MEGRATFLPFQDTLPGSVMNQRSLALPGAIAGMINTATAPRRAYQGGYIADENGNITPAFNAEQEATDFGLNVMGGGFGASRVVGGAPSNALGMFIGKSAKINNETAKHSPEQMAKWAQEKFERETKQLIKFKVESEANKKLAQNAVNNYGKTGISQHFTPEQINQIKSYRLAGDRFGAQAEGRSQAVNFLKSELERLGVPIQHQSNIGGGNSIYANVNGKTVRISDHDLPMTPERMHNNDIGLKGKWDKNVVVDDWQNKSLSDYLLEIGFTSL